MFLTSSLKATCSSGNGGTQPRSRRSPASSAKRIGDRTGPHDYTLNRIRSGGAGASGARRSSGASSDVAADPFADSRRSASSAEIADRIRVDRQALPIAATAALDSLRELVRGHQQRQIRDSAEQICELLLRRSSEGENSPPPADNHHSQDVHAVRLPESCKPHMHLVSENPHSSNENLQTIAQVGTLFIFIFYI